MKKVYVSLAVGLIFLGAAFLVAMGTDGVAKHKDIRFERQEVLKKTILGFSGYELPIEIEQFLKTSTPAGVILFDRNIQNTNQLRQLIVSIRKVAFQPIKILVDQEGGRVARLRPATGFAQEFPSAEELGRRPVSESFAAGYEIGKMLSDVGIDMNLAPVVDLAIDGGYIGSRGRAFGADIEEVASRAAAFLKGMAVWGVQGCLKHFPGHGSARLDPHHDFTDVTHLYQSHEIEVFRRTLDLLGKDFTPYPALLLGHLVHKDWDENYPASFSKKVIQEKVRKDLGFQGIMMTDDIEMGAIGRPVPEAMRLAIEAGVDWILICDTQPQDQPHPPAKTIEDLEAYCAEVSH